MRFAEHAPRIGDWVLAVGNPFGLGGTVTAGIVSARGRDIGAGPYDDFIQIDAPVNKGNSGGPTFDVDGNVIGVNTAIFSPSGGSVGIAFAIPADTVKSVVAQLKDKGAVTRGWIGVQIQPVTADIADSLGLKTTQGALVAEPQADGPAVKAGIQAGDVITAVNGNAGQGRPRPRPADRRLAPGASVKLTVLRKGQEKTLHADARRTAERSAKPRRPIATRASRPAPTRAAAWPDARAGRARSPAAAAKAWSSPMSIPNGVAAEHGFKTGDVILEVGGKKVGHRGRGAQCGQRARRRTASAPC